MRFISLSQLAGLALFDGIYFAAANQEASSLPEIDVGAFEERTFKNKIDHFNFLDEREYD